VFLPKQSFGNIWRECDSEVMECVSFLVRRKGYIAPLFVLLTFVVALVVGGIVPTHSARAANAPLIGVFNTVSTIASTIPSVEGGALQLFVVRL